MITELLESNEVSIDPGVVDDFVQGLLSPIQSRTMQTKSKTACVETKKALLDLEQIRIKLLDIEKVNKSLM